MNSKETNENLGWLQPTITTSGLTLKHVIQIPNFLPQQERDAFFDVVCTNQAMFQSIGQAGSSEGGPLHLSLGSEKLEDQKLVLIREVAASLSERIMKLLPDLFTGLGVQPFPVSHIPLTIVNGLNGHKSLPHTDESGGRFKISLLYYFNNLPKAFQGGALEFYKADANGQSGYIEQAFAKI
ncbi:MAG: hypothetical protein AAGD05_05335, partial [Bacteroidota bacterium]